MTELDYHPDSKTTKRDARSPQPSPFTPSSLGETSSSFPLHQHQQTVPVETEPYYDIPDDDVAALLDGVSASGAAPNDELPPQYSALPPSRLGPDPLGPTSPFEESLPGKTFKNMSGDVQFYLDRRLDSDADYLQRWLEYQAAYPPRAFVRVEGSHNETRIRTEPSSSHGRRGSRHSETKTETQRVVDFDVRVELTPFLYSDIENRKSWRRVRTAGNLEKVHRGTVRATRAAGFGGSGSGSGGEETPTLKEWCYLFCAASGLKTFRLRKRVCGFDAEWLKPRLEALVRETGYQGRVEITFPVIGENLDVYNSSWVNEWRLTRWVRWIFFLTLMFLFVWPYLYFATRKWEVLFVEWDFSRQEGMGGKRYVSVSEDGWLRIWEKGIQRYVVLPSFHLEELLTFVPQGGPW